MISLRSPRRKRRGSEWLSGRRPFFFHHLLFLSLLLACAFELQESPGTQGSEEVYGDAAVEIEVMELGDEHALASTGYFSLVFRKMEGRWKILHDHTSARPDPEGP